MLVGIDIDGVLVDFEKYIRETGSSYLKLPIHDKSGYDIAEMYKVSMEVETKFWYNNILNYVSEYPIREGAVEFIQTLVNQGDRWVIITDRCKDLSYCRWPEFIMQYHVENFIHDIVSQVL